MFKSGVASELGGPGMFWPLLRVRVFNNIIFVLILKVKAEKTRVFSKLLKKKDKAGKKARKNQAREIDKVSSDA